MRRGLFPSLPVLTPWTVSFLYIRCHFLTDLEMILHLWRDRSRSLSNCYAFGVFRFSDRVP
jgi:hypothetical protein